MKHNNSRDPEPTGPGDVKHQPEQAETLQASVAKDQTYGFAIGPRRLAEYVGQSAVCEQMEVFITAARNRDEALDHTLIFGPPGLGKTTLAHIMAHEMHCNLHQTSGPVLEKPGDLAALLTNPEPGDVLSLTRSTVSAQWWRKSFTRRWRTSSSTS